MEADVTGVVPEIPAPESSIDRELDQASADWCGARAWLESRPAHLLAGSVTLRVGEFEKTVTFLEGHVIKDVAASCIDILSYAYANYRLKKMSESVR